MRSALILFTVCTLLFTACKKTCKSEKIGFRALEDTTLAFGEFTMGDTLAFTSDDGAVKQFEIRQDGDYTHLCVNVTCRPLDPYKPKGCEYIEGESYYYTLWEIDGSHILHVKLLVEQYEMESRLFFEWIAAGVSSEFDYDEESIVTYVEFSQPAFLLENTSLPRASLRHESYTIGQYQFDHVHLADLSSGQLLFAESGRLVAVQLGQVWYFRK